MYNSQKMDVTGPIQPNDIVMRASEIGQSMPGIGALAYKQARKGAQKGVKGIHMIPESNNQNVDFMNIARQNVNAQLTGMANAVEAASAPPGHMLAFITPQEAGILKLLGGSGEMTESGVPSFRPTPSDTKKNTENRREKDDTKNRDGISSLDKAMRRRPDAFAAADVAAATDRITAAGGSLADEFGRGGRDTKERIENLGMTQAEIDKEYGTQMMADKSLAVRDMMTKASGYNPDIKGYDNPFNQGMSLDVGYGAYDKLIGKGYTPQEIARMKFDQSKGLLGDMKFNATLDGKPVGAFNINKAGGFLDNVFGRGGFTFTRDYMDQGNRGRDRDNRRNFVEEMIDQEVGSGAGETGDYLDPSEAYLPSDYTSDRITEGDLVPGRRRFMLRKDGKKIPEGDNLTLDEIRNYAMVGGFNLLEPFSEYQARRRQYYGAPDFGQGTDFDYSGSTGGTGN
tara:strand:- start:2520 stop:3884 length:1365 start_codon:yes stop_codon:yes gene_type:complete